MAHTYDYDLCPDCGEEILPNSIGEYPPLSPKGISYCSECYEDYRVAACEDMFDLRHNY